MNKLIVLAGCLLFTGIATAQINAQAPISGYQQLSPEANINRLDSLMQDYHDRHYDFCTDLSNLNKHGFQETDVPKYSGDVIEYRLSLLESPIPLEYNSYVQPYIDLYAVRKRKLTANILGNSKYYFPMFEQVLDQQGLPLEFKYLSVIESALNPNAVSWCGATGLWQFMYGTGLMYGLKINQQVDERKDPYKATLAACQYFKDMYAMYHDWLLVIAAYNCGAGNVNRAIKRSGGRTTFWEIQRFLPVETRGYVPAFIAAAYVMNYASEHNIFPNESQLNYMTDTVHVEQRVSFAELSSALQLPIEELQRLNPSYKWHITPYAGNSTALINLPHHKVIAYTDLKGNLWNSYNQPRVGSYETPQPQTPVKPIHYPKQSAYYKRQYRVKQGDGLYLIAKNFNCSINDLKRWNKLSSNAIYPGQMLYVFQKS